jgi:hypothetical protein
MTAQDKILYVANKLGLTSLKNMQASTGAVYDADTENSGQIFSSAARHQNPGVTNLTQNEFEVNEALLVETIGFYFISSEEGEPTNDNFQKIYGSNAVLVYDLIIGNKRVMKSTPVFGAGSPYTFAINGIRDITSAPNSLGNAEIYPRHQVYLEGAGILIPPQIQWSVEYRIFNVVTGAVIPFRNTFENIGCYLFGTRVLLNFNTSI